MKAEIFIIQSKTEDNAYFDSMCECPAETVNIVFDALVKEYHNTEFRVLRKSSFSVYGHYIPDKLYCIGM